MDTIFIFVLGFYLIAMLGIGIFASKLVTDTTDFLLAGRKLGLGMCIATLCATHLGGGNIIGTGGDAYKFGISGMAFGFGTGVALIILGLVAAKPLRKLAICTLPDFLAMRYKSNWVRGLSSFLSLVALIGILAAQVGATKGILSAIGVEPFIGSIIATVIFIAYSAISGMWGVALTDFVQLAIILIGLPVSAILGFNLAGGWNGIQTALASTNITPNEVGGYFDILGRGVPVIIGLILPMVMYDLVGQDFYQRLFSAKDENVAKKAALIGGVVLMIVSFISAVIGMSARALIGDISPDQAIAALATLVLPQWAGALLIAALVGAVMSTADSILIAGTSHVVNDFYNNIINRGNELSTDKMLKISRICTVIIGILALLIALVMPGIISILIYSYTFYTCGVVVPTILGLFWKRGTKEAAISSILAGTLTALLNIIGLISYGKVPTIIVGFFVSLTVYVLVSFMTKVDSEATIVEKNL